MRSNYRGARPSKAPYIFGAIIIFLIWQMKEMHDDSMQAIDDMNRLRKTCAEDDSLLADRTRHVDSLTAVVDWYRKQELAKAKKPVFTRTKPDKKAPEAPAQADTTK